MDLSQSTGKTTQLEKQLTTVLRDLGYRAIEQPNSMIESSTSGSKFSIFVQQDGWLLFALRLVNQSKFSLESVNDFNRRYRFGKLCLDVEGDLYFSADMRISLDSVVESFNDCVTLWDQLVGLLSRSLHATAS